MTDEPFPGDGTPTAPTEHQDTRLEKALVVVGIVVLGFNLRPAAVSVGPVVDEITSGLRMSPVSAGLLTSLPVLAFALFGGLTPGIAARLGTHRTTLLALVAVVIGLAGRSTVHNPQAFLALSLLALAGMATSNVLLPSLVKQHFPDRVGLMTSVYTTMLAVGTAASTLTTVPISEAAGSWRVGIGVWAATALVAVAPWLGLLRHDRTLRQSARTVTFAQIARTRLGWAMAVTFALQSTQAYAAFGWLAQIYRDAGFGAQQAAVLLTVATAVGIPTSLLVPPLAARFTNQSAITLTLVACYLTAYLGLILAPVGGAYAWAILLGLGMATFPLVLTQIPLRTKTFSGTAALSGFTQSVGYLLSAPGPFLVGWLGHTTGNWTASLILLMGIAIALGVSGLTVARPRYLEDELTRPAR
ncbi:MAG: MFS transporter [Nocardioidaceae bacterium]